MRNMLRMVCCLSVCLSSWRISSDTTERIWLKFSVETQVCRRHYISLFGGDRPRGPIKKAENVVFSNRQ